MREKVRNNHSSNFLKIVFSLLFLLITQTGWAQKTTPTLEITPVDGSGFLNNSFKSVYPNWGTFDEPTVSLFTESGGVRTSVADKYKITYYINGHENDASFSSDENGRQYTADDAADATQSVSTGTTVTRFYGDVKVGTSAGEVTIKVVAKVKEAFKDSYAETVTGTYKFTIVKVTPDTYTVTPSTFTIPVYHVEKAGTGDPKKFIFTNTSAMIPLPSPTVSITKGTQVQDLSEVYDVTFAPKTGSESYLEVNSDGVAKGLGVADYVAAKLTEEEKGSPYAEAAAALNPYSTPQAATLVATFTPKSSYADAYNEVSVEIPVTINVFNPESKLTASLTLNGVTASDDKDAAQSETNTLHWSRWNQRGTEESPSRAIHTLPVPVVTGSNGADLSNHPQLKVCYFAVEDNTYEDKCQLNDMNPFSTDWWEAGVSTEGDLARQAGKVRALHESLSTYQSNKAGLLKVGVFVYLDDPFTYDNGSTEFTENTEDASRLYNWYSYTKEQTVGDNTTEGYYTTYDDNVQADKYYRRITPVKYFYIDVMKRVPELVFDPDPTGVHYSTADKINFTNRFDLSGRIGDENDGTAATLTYGPQWGAGDDTFWYSFEFAADAGIVVNDWPHYDRMIALDSEGNTITPDSYDWDHNGRPVYSEEKTAQIVAYRYWAVKGFGTDDLWSVQFTTPGTKEVKYTIYPFNHARWDVGTTITKSYIIDAAKRTSLHIDPQELVATVSQPGFVEPEVWVTDAFDEEVSKDYSFTYTILSTTEDETDGYVHTTVTDDGGDATGPKHEITIGNRTGDVVVQVTATTTNAAYDEGCQTLIGTYTIHIMADEGGEPLYEIISSKDEGAQRNTGNTGTTDEDYARDNVMGKMHFIRAGKFYSGYTISGVPGIDIRFGVFDGSTWDVKEDSSDDIGSYDNANDIVGGVQGQHNKFIGDDTPVVLNEDGIATGGHFYEFYAHTNGFLTVDARWEAAHTYVLIDYDYPEMKYEYTPASLTKGDYTFPMALLEDHSYHLYCTTGGQINMHGFAFSPAFIKNSSDTAPATSGSAFLNNFLDVPTLAVASMPTVTYTSGNTSKATVNSSTGLVTPVDLTYAEVPNYVKISGKVVSQVSSLAENVFKMPHYNLVIADIPTYRLGDKKDASGEGKDGFTNAEEDAIYVPAPGTQVTTYNIPTPIIMTYGGWQNKYTMITPTETKTDQQDSFKAKSNTEIAGFTSTDTQFNKYIDGFTWSNVANQNPSDERGYTDYKNYLTGAENMSLGRSGYYMNSFTLPAHGSYWRFEPLTSGYMFVYLVQNGICSYSGDPHSLQNTSKMYYGLDWKPLYIVDEAGNPVSTVSDWGSMNESVKSFLGDHGSYTLGLIRCDKDDEAVKTAAENVGEAPTNDFSFVWDYKKKDGRAGFDVDYKGSDANKTALHGTIESGWTGKGNTQTIFQDPESKGYSMISKAYVRYAIRVKAGKSYWVFQNASKPNLCGFGFVPDGFDGTPENYNGPAPVAVTISDNAEADAFTGGSFSNYDVPCNVTYTNRQFRDQHWTSICLPFAVSEHNFKKVFGANAKIFTYENMTNSNTCVNFVQHNYRMIEAGRPYFIYPDFDNKETLSTASSGYKYKENLLFEGVTFEENKPAASDKTQDLQKLLIISESGFDFVGTYVGEQMPQYSYYINGKIYRAAKEGGLPCGRYRAYLKNPTADASLAKLGGYVFEEPFEDVEEAVEPTKVVGITNGTLLDTDGYTSLKGVYTIEGQKLYDNSKDMKTLPAGIYVIDGKKCVVK